MTGGQGTPVPLDSVPAGSLSFTAQGNVVGVMDQSFFFHFSYPPYTNSASRNTPLFPLIPDSRMDMDLALEMQHAVEKEVENETQVARYRRHRRTRSAFFIEQEERGKEEGRRRRASQHSQSGGSLSLSPQDLMGRGDNDPSEHDDTTKEAEAAFSLSDFLSTREHLPLDALYDELKDALKEIRGRRVDVLSVEYGAFIGLGKDLHGLDGDIQEMRTALLQMSREIQGTEHALDSSISRLHQALHDETTRYHTIQAGRRVNHGKKLREHLDGILQQGALDEVRSQGVMDTLESLALLGPLSDVEEDERRCKEIKRGREALVECLECLVQGEEEDEGMEKAKAWLEEHQVVPASHNES
ncbi:hypothetical protein BJ684DRAFT_21858 [Piptocephalis cylindrospora]|uniref:Conserved oligomeric Golgi complex subunit 2 n=1 Tax=Piptocephalis cylindrospora TaxID=1907219 RepID=A0A4P9XZJ4_9FUNG|nr:hypothetical protein BJ684DRAFT_21858 [Piptocephalis cylindrospora]|eukprot:RKP11562.1 hypothetical protein BJ684DRAFT_21858 [Piptocephalis cylindrospora]